VFLLCREYHQIGKNCTGGKHREFVPMVEKGKSFSFSPDNDDIEARWKQGSTSSKVTINKRKRDRCHDCAPTVCRMIQYTEVCDHYLRLPANPPASQVSGAIRTHLLVRARHTLPMELRVRTLRHIYLHTSLIIRIVHLVLHQWCF
jgi:hypothetical protein